MTRRRARRSPSGSHGTCAAAVVVADGETLGGVLPDPAEVFGDALADLLERLVAGAAEGGMDADACRRAAVDGDERRHLALLGGEDRGPVGSPYRVDGLRDDRAVVAAQAAAARPFSRLSRRTRSLDVRSPA